MASVTIEQSPKYTISHCRINPTTATATISLVAEEDCTTTTTTSASQSTRSSSSVNSTHVKQYPIVVLDNSGSMSQNNRFKNCKFVVNSLLEITRTLELITYNSSASYHGIVKKFPDNITPDYQTFFFTAFEMIIITLKSRVKTLSRGDIVTIVFTTDGEDTSQRNLDIVLKNLKRELLEFYETHGVNVIIHTVGVDADAHSKFLVDLSHAGTVEGTFGAFNPRTNDHVAEAERLADLICNKSTIVQFQGKSFALTSSEPIVRVFYPDSESDFKMGSLKDEISFLIDQLNSMAAGKTTLSLNSVKNIAAMANDIFIKAGRLDRVERRLTRSALEPLNHLVREFYSAFNNPGANGGKGKTPLHHSVIAKLNIAAREARSSKPRFIKTAVDRSNANIAVIEEEDAIIQNLIGNSTFLQDIPESHRTQLEDFTCIFTQNDAMELVKDGDCVGIGFSADAPEVCMHDATRLVFLDVGTSFFSCSEFLAASLFSVSNLSFQESTSVLKDASGLMISGVLPLYINETHWKVARRHAKRMASHLCCKDPYMSTRSILLYTYYGAYSHLKSSKRNNGEKIRQLTNLLKETLIRVYQEDCSSVIPSPLEIISDVSKRVSSVVQSSSLLVPMLLDLEILTTREESFQMVRRYLLEETMRRGSKERISIGDLCTIDEKVLVDPYVKRMTRDTKDGALSPVVDKMSKMILSIADSYPHEVTKLAQDAMTRIIRGEYNVDEETGTCVDYGQDDESDGDDKEILNFHPRFDSNVAKTLFSRHSSVLQDMSDNRRVAIILQTHRLLSESEYVASYKDWFVASEDEVDEHVRNLCIAHIKLRRQAMITEIISSRRNNELTGVLQYLERNDITLLERVAMMHGVCYVGRNIVPFASTIRTHNDYKMIRDGQFDIAPLIGYKHGPVIVFTVMDKSKNSLYTPNRWSPSAANYRKIIKQIEGHQE